MSHATAAADIARDYVNRLSRALRFLPPEDRTAIVAEIESHISDCTSAGGKSVEETLDHLGDPEVLAKAYIEQFKLEGALVRSAYGSLLLTILERATRSVLALTIGISAVLLYGFSLSFAAMAVLKPVWPEHVGWWVHGNSFNLGVLDKAPAGTHEVLGYWIMPVSVIGCIAFFLAGRMLLRLGGRMLLRKKPLQIRA